MSKYDPLGIYLKQSNQNRITLTFAEIETIVGFTLPKSLKNRSEAWLGTAEGSPRHVQKRVWQSAGYQVETVQLSQKVVTFKKI